MRYLLGFLCVCALGMMPLVGCSDATGDGGSGGSAGSGGAGGAAGSGGSGGSDTVAVEIRVTAPVAMGQYPGPVLEGVEVCETDTTNCVTTDINGDATLMLAANQLLSYTLAKNGYMTRLHAVATDDAFDNEPFTFFPLFSDQIMEGVAADLQIPYPFEGGWVALQATPFYTAGVTHDLLSETATAYYTNEAAIPTLGLTETTSDGQGGFLEVTADEEHQAEFGGTVTNCTARIGWPGDAANRIKFPVRVGHMTFARAVCDAL